MKIVQKSNHSLLGFIKIGLVLNTQCNQSSSSWKVIWPSPISITIITVDCVQVLSKLTQHIKIDWEQWNLEQKSNIIKGYKTEDKIQCAQY